jgi:ATP-dependent helicase HrpB
VSQPLPIHQVIPHARQALAGPGCAVLVAAPGAGKTTVVPLELLEEPWLQGQRVVMLEPRRLAARYAARRMAATLGEPVGGAVGHRVRFDTRVSARTRIEVVTEGVLTRMLQGDPTLEGIGLVIFDEFHERSLQADAGLALTLRSRAALRPDLRILVMSATIDAAAVARLLGGAPVIECPGRAFPVETRYRPPRADRLLDANVTSLIREALAEEPGDVLVFLPGVGEIARVRDRLTRSDPPLDALVLPLHGSLPVEEQDAALLPGRRRRVVLATSIAETSLTIEGVRIVIDAGRMRVPRFSPRTGMTRLETARVTRASADQRRGRAGRLGPGVCYRLWSPAEEAGLLPFNPPEILTSDLAPLALDLAAAGVADPAELAWLDPPPAGAWSQARELLRLFGAIDAAGAITARGQALADLALHPRLAQLVTGARDRGLLGLAAELVTLLAERDLVRRGERPPDADLRLRVESLRAGRGVHGLEIHPGALHRARRDLVRWRTRLGADHSGPDDVDECGRLLALAYPDRIAQRRIGQAGRFLLRNGRGAALSPDQTLARNDYLVIADLDDKGAEARIALAAPIDLGAVEEACAAAIEREETIAWNAARRAVEARVRLRLGAIVLEERVLERPDPARVRAELLRGLAREGPAALPWSERGMRLRSRVRFLRMLDPDRWPDWSDSALTTTMEEWLGPHAGDASCAADIAALDLGGLLSRRLSGRDRADLDLLAPERFETPAGSRIAIDYTDPAAPALAVKLQEMLGSRTTPAIALGRVPLVLHLLSPAGRPVQVTRDLPGFWRTSYLDVRKDLRGRYPKHEWPEDPLAARPARGPKRRAR